MTYKAFKKRQANATPYADKANCRRCKHSEQVRASAFCMAFGRPRKIPYANWDTTKEGYCTEFMPIQERKEE